VQKKKGAMMADQQLNALCLDLGTVTGWAMCTDRILASGTVDFKNNRFEGGGNSQGP